MSAPGRPDLLGESTEDHLGRGADITDDLFGPPAEPPSLPPPVDTPDEPDAAPDADAQRLATALAHHVRRWSLALCGDAAAAEAAARAAEAVSLAASEGHVGIALADLDTPAQDAAPRPPTAWRALLQASGVVGSPPDTAVPHALPLVLDDHDRLYLHRHFDQERRLARRLVDSATAPPQPLSPAARALLQSLFPAGPEPNAQHLAAALALRQRLAVISGGPGTGKTTTVVALLGGLLADDPNGRIALAAPTGKAAARMTDALRERAATLPPALRERLPREASTLHRLLGARPGGFAHSAANPLALDALVVDEASMLDLSLATRLFDALPPTARVILLGDKDQLAAVEAGAVFAELSADPSLSAACRHDLAAACGLAADALPAPPPGPPGPLVDSTVWLRRNFRFAADSGIGRLAADLQAGDADAVLHTLRKGAGAGLRWLDDGADAPGPLTRQALAEGHADFAQALLDDPGDVARVSAAFASFQVLCAVRRGPRGTEAVNASMAQWLRERLQRAHPGLHGEARSSWFAGRPVLVRRNDPLLRLFNGDVGLALPDAAGRLQVHFPQPGGGFRALPPQRLPEHDTAFALTVHQSQGSEFERVLVLLPRKPSRVASRELLYTAVTRARREVTLAAPASVLAAAVRSPTRRGSGLHQRLAEAAAEATGNALPPDAPPAGADLPA